MCGDGNGIDGDNGDDGDTMNRHFAENQEHLARSPESATLSIYQYVSLLVGIRVAQ
jgi:hypothetical protein